MQRNVYKMTEEEIRSHIAANIAHYRRQMNLTQTELSDRINYSDKSVSKWERAEGVPDIYVLSQLAEIFGVGVDDLLSAEPPRRRTGGRKQRLFITLLSTGLVWLCACFAFFICMLFVPDSGRNWLAFIVAIPVSGVVLTVFTCLWWKLIPQFLSVSLIEWGIAVTLHLSFNIPNMGLIYVFCGVLEVLTVLWYGLKLIRHRSRVTAPPAPPKAPEA